MRVLGGLLILSALVSMGYAASQLCKSECSVPFKTLGCYKDEEVPKRRLPHYILNDRDPSIPNYSGIKINWYDWNNYMQDFACRCAKKAKAMGYDLFGLQFYGECWAGNSHLHMPRREDKASGCIQDDYKQCGAWNRYCIGHQWYNAVYKIEQERCEVEFERVGCYRDNHFSNARPLSRYALNDRDPHHPRFSGKLIDWRSWDVYVPDFACRCAKKARELGSNFFGLQFYGECYTGHNGDKGNWYARDGPKHTCVNNCYGKCKSYDKFCVGEHYTNAVYRIAGPCEIQIKEMGCYKETTSNRRLLKTQIINAIDPTSEHFVGQIISSHKWIKDFSHFLCSCARKVQEKGYRYFGVNSIGSCWSGTASDQYGTLGASSECYQGKKDTPCTSGDKVCAGWNKHTNFVYEIVHK